MNNPINPLMVVNQRLQVTLAERNKARTQVLAQRQGGTVASLSVTGQGAGASAGPQLVQVQAYAGGGGGQQAR